ncbi:hypothetical protein G6045_02725 [Streptomyces sp. YC504]|uniref:Uncharacterized protein n=1 Tax=Streptomyces mesophilus TaxID=1775132 RepID=A0A6G4XD02_9ACTN|nr:hypothetical protein [Streptomyces mesophilus]NGO74604.1 hypothetical protein [Streptomyces mesophilus]
MGTWTAGLLGPLLGGVAVALTTYWTTRARAQAEARKLDAEAEKTRAETTKILAEVGIHAQPVPTTHELPKGWGASGGVPEDYEVGVDFDLLPSRRACAFIRSREQGQFEYASLLQTIRADDYRGARVELSAMVKARDVASWAGLWIRVDDASDNILAFGNMYHAERRITGTQNWRRCSVVLDVPEAGAYLNFGLVMQRTGQVWMYDVQLEVVDDDVPVTDFLALLPRRPTNLDFEDGVS